VQDVVGEYCGIACISVACVGGFYAGSNPGQFLGELLRALGIYLHVVGHCGCGCVVSLGQKFTTTSVSRRC
jgi:hypothetical protein